jgi:methionine synthase II (cobalamin-independent)
MALDYAAAVNEEIRDLFAAGTDIVQIERGCSRIPRRRANMV